MLTQQKRSSETRRQILLAATTLFHEKGYKATTLRDIAHSIKKSAGSFYYYFSSKDDLVRHVLDRGIANVEDMVRTAVMALPDGSTATMRIRAAIRGHLRALLDVRGYSTAYARIYNQLPRQIKRRDHPGRIAYINYWRELVMVAQRQGEIKPEINATVFVDFLVGAISRTTDWYIPSTTSIDELAQWIGDWVITGVSVEGESQQSFVGEAKPDSGRRRKELRSIG